MFVSFLTQFLDQKDDILQVFEKAGIVAKEKPYVIVNDLTYEEYNQLKSYPLSLDDIVIGNEYHKKYEQVLPHFLRYEHSTVNIDGEDIQFADCGETAFLNFCLCFLWDNHKINSHRWEKLKKQYPTFAPFVDFFEKNSTLDLVKQNRSTWATCMAFKEWNGIKPTYQRKKQAEIIGGNQSFLNLISILFKEDAIMHQAFKSEKLSDLEDQELAKQKWGRLLEILNQDVQITFKNSDLTHKNNIEIAFVNQNDEFIYALRSCHFYLLNTNKKYPQSVLKDHYQQHPLLSLFSSSQIHEDMEYFWYTIGFQSYQVNNTVKKIPYIDMMTIMMRRLISTHLGALDDVEGIDDELKIFLDRLHPTLSPYAQFIKLLNTPICREYFFKYFALSCLGLAVSTRETINSSFIRLLSDNNTELKSHKNCAIRFFKELAESNHPQRYKVLAYYDQEIYIKHVFKCPHHPDYATLFSGKIDEKHAFTYALRGGAEKVLNCYAQLDFWKVYNGTLFEERLYLLSSILTKNGPDFLIKNYPDIFLFDGDNAESSIKRMLAYVPYPENFEKIWGFYKKHDPNFYTEEWLLAPYQDDTINENFLDERGLANIIYTRIYYASSLDYKNIPPFIRAYGTPKCIHRKFVVYFLEKHRLDTGLRDNPDFIFFMLEYVDVFDLEVLNVVLNHPDSTIGSDQYNGIMESAPTDVVEQYKYEQTLESVQSLFIDPLSIPYNVRGFQN